LERCLLGVGRLDIFVHSLVRKLTSQHTVQIIKLTGDDLYSIGSDDHCALVLANPCGRQLPSLGDVQGPVAIGGKSRFGFLPLH